MPSGSRLPSLTITLRSEPSGFAENTCPLLALRKNKRAVVVFATGLLIVDLAVLTAISCFRSFISLVFGKNRLNRKPQFHFHSATRRRRNRLWPYRVSGSVSGRCLRRSRALPHRQRSGQRCNLR